MPIFSRNDAKECSVDAFPVLQRVKFFKLQPHDEDF
jgi:hypothetical protein